MRKNKHSLRHNTFMVLVIAILAVVALLFAGYVRGWFSLSFANDAEDNQIEVQDIFGITTVERAGIESNLAENTTIKSQDILYTADNSQITLVSKDHYLKLNEESELLVNSPNNHGLEIELRQGEIFGVANNSLSLIIKSKTAVINESTVFSLITKDNNSILRVYTGEIKIDNSIIEAGEQVKVSKSDFAVSSYDLNGIDNFQKSELEKANATFNLDLDLSKESNQSQKDASVAKSDETLTCTIEINCKAILDNMENLKSGKDRFVPQDGYILKPTQINFHKGETAFDVLKQICQENDIQIEYSWTPVYDSYYIESLNHLYEFDCGKESGWMYSVNGQFANYGASQYVLEDKDEILWEYTCSGLGTDLGAEVMGVE